MNASSHIRHGKAHRAKVLSAKRRREKFYWDMRKLGELGKFRRAVYADVYRDHQPLTPRE